jgi:hypothetical protein
MRNRTIKALKATILAAMVSASGGPGSYAFAAEPGTGFLSGEIWPDDKGEHINAQDGGILSHQGVCY